MSLIPHPEAANSAADPARHAAVPLLDQAGEQARALARNGVDAMREQTRQLRLRARRWSRGTVAYIQDEPVKAVLIAAAAGAGLSALLALLGRSREPD